MKKPLASVKQFTLPVVPPTIQVAALKAHPEPTSYGTHFPRYKNLRIELSREAEDWLERRLAHPRLKGRAIGKRRNALLGNPNVQALVSSDPGRVIDFIVISAKDQKLKQALCLKGYIPVGKRAVQATVRFTGEEGTITF